MEVSYLLQRIESYNGLAIVTTNIEDSLDSAFIRRLRYIVKFPFPGVRERALIWQKVYPPGVLKENNPKIFEMLGHMEISGGLIYSIALKSAFLAADDGKDGVYLAHIHQAAKSEYTKIGRTLSISETPWIRSM
jgi:AAA+ superfamily predicted ATPase